MRVLLLDIETAPHKVYVWGLWQQNVAINQIEEPGYVLCWSAKWLDEKEIMFSSVYEHTKEDMLSALYDLVSEADVVVHYNGTKFDMPTLNREWIANGFPPPAPYAQIDLYTVIKKKFRFPSNKLDYIVNELGIGAKVNHKGMELWRECMFGEADSWKVMEKYNKQDVVLLEALYNRMLPWIGNHPNRGLYAEAETFVCPACGSEHVQKRGLHHTKTQVYQRYACMDCGTWSRERTTLLPKEKRKFILGGIG